MLNKMVSLPDEKLKNDATDALAVAWCHYMKGRGLPGAVKRKHIKIIKSRIGQVLLRIIRTG